MEEKQFLWELGLKTIQELETEKGILASGKEEIYGCIFGRDSLITSLKLLRVYERTHEDYFLLLVKKILLHLSDLLGSEINIESGEEPGKCIHEFRPENYEHLTHLQEKPWYLYWDNILRNYDSVDSTPLFLIACYRYFEKSHDRNFLDDILPKIQLSLDWVLKYGDKNEDGFIDYQLHPKRKFGGLVTQSWMDSAESLFHEDGLPVMLPVAPVEVQAYTFLATKLWSLFFTFEKNFLRAEELWTYSMRLKERFNEIFPQYDEDGFFLASGIDGNGKPLRSVRSSMGHVLWSAYNFGISSLSESILEEESIPLLVKRLMKEDLFEPKAGVRTLSKKSRMFSYNSYHNGSIWPHDTSMIAEGLDYFGYFQEALFVRKGLLEALKHFRTPIELFVYTENAYEEYCSISGQKACQKQAWAAAALLKEITGVKEEF